MARSSGFYAHALCSEFAGNQFRWRVRFHIERYNWTGFGPAKFNQPVSVGAAGNKYNYWRHQFYRCIGDQFPDEILSRHGHHTVIPAVMQVKSLPNVCSFDIVLGSHETAICSGAWIDLRHFLWARKCLNGSKSVRPRRQLERHHRQPRFQHSNACRKHPDHLASR